MTKFVEISSLVTEGLQTRDGLAKAVVKDYAETLKAGMRLPPVTVVQDSVSGRLYLVDGYHRKAATVMAGRTMIDAEITEGTFTDAVRLAIRANATNGLRRTNADKRNALKLAWEHRRELFPGEPSHELLAKACGISERTVRRFRNLLTGVDNVHPRGTRLGTDGKTYALSQQDAKRSTETDRYGAAVPERLAKAFDLREYHLRVQAVQNAKNAFEKAIRDRDFSCSKVSQATLITFANLIHDLKSEEPWCVCRQCGGGGCRACGSVGVQTMDEYLRNPKELRPDA